MSKTVTLISLLRILCVEVENDIAKEIVNYKEACKIRLFKRSSHAESRLVMSDNHITCFFLVGVFSDHFN